MERHPNMYWKFIQVSLFGIKNIAELEDTIRSKVLYEALLGSAKKNKEHVEESRGGGEGILRLLEFS